MSVFTDYKKEIMDAVHNERIRMALSRAIASYRANTNSALGKFPHTIEMAEEVRVKSQSHQRDGQTGPTGSRSYRVE